MFNSNIKSISEIRRGSVTGISVTGGSYTDTSVTFSSAMSGTPYIVCGFSNDVTNQAYCNTAIIATNRSSTGFTLRVLYSTSGGTITPSVHWIAIY